MCATKASRTGVMFGRGARETRLLLSRVSRAIRPPCACLRSPERLVKIVAKLQASFAKKLCRKWALRTFTVLESTNSQQLSIDHTLTDHKSVVKSSKLRSETLISPVDLLEF